MWPCKASCGICGVFGNLVFRLECGLPECKAKGQGFRDVTCIPSASAWLQIAGYVNQGMFYAAVVVIFQAAAPVAQQYPVAYTFCETLAEVPGSLEFAAWFP